MSQSISAVRIDNSVYLETDRKKYGVKDPKEQLKVIQILSTPHAVYNMLYKGDSAHRDEQAAIVVALIEALPPKAQAKILDTKEVAVALITHGQEEAVIRLIAQIPDQRLQRKILVHHGAAGHLIFNGFGEKLLDDIVSHLEETLQRDIFKDAYVIMTLNMHLGIEGVRLKQKVRDIKSKWIYADAPPPSREDVTGPQNAPQDRAPTR